MRRFLTLLSLSLFLGLQAQDNPTWRQLDGSMMPIDLHPFEAASLLPDSLELVTVRHVGRHGARFLSSGKKTAGPRKRLMEARREGKLTPKGEEFLRLLNLMDSIAAGRWGELDALGLEEQTAIGRWLARDYMADSITDVAAKASYVPRVVMSMYGACHGIVLQKPTEAWIQTSSGTDTNPLLRFFETDSAFLAYKVAPNTKALLEAYSEAVMPEAPAHRLVEGLSRAEAQKLTGEMRAVVSGFSATGHEIDRSRWFTYEEYLACWKVSNFEHWLIRTATNKSHIPALAATPLLEALAAPVPHETQLFFGHAETLMPLLSLMGMEGCVAPEVKYTDVWRQWRDYEVVPLAACVTFIFAKGPSGKLYTLSLHNGRPVSPAPGVAPLASWSELRSAWHARVATLPPCE